jgi:oligoribonuclease (3'-5' exoribonuclease)
LIEVAAGRAAERKFGATQDFFDANGSHDREKLVAVACAVTDSDAESLAYIAEIEAEAARLVDEHWAAIQAVARALHAAGSLDEAQIRAAINSADIENANGG